MSRHFLQNFFLFFFCILSTVRLWAQTDINVSTYSTIEPLKFEYASAEDHRFIFQDSKGFLWGMGGLNWDLMRFDGQEIQYFSSDPQDSTSFSGCPLWPNNAEILEDQKGGIWIQSSTNCLDRFDPEIEQFERIAERLPTVIKFWDLFEDHQGNIWVGTSSGLAHYDINTEEISFFNPPDKRPIKTIFEDDEKNIWLLIDGESNSPVLFQLDASGNFINRIAPDLPPYPGMLGNGKNYAFNIGTRDSILVLTDHRLYLFEPRTQQFSSVPTPFNQDEFAISLFVTNQLILVGTSRERVFQMAPNGSFTPIKAMSKPKNPHGLGSNVLDIFQDRDGVIWINLVDSGVKKISSQSSKLTTLNILENARGYWPGDQLFEFNGTVWFNALPQMRPANGGQATTPLLNVGMPGFETDTLVFYRFDQDTSGNLWVAAFKKEGFSSIRQFGSNGKLLYQFSCEGISDQCFNGAFRNSNYKLDQNGFSWMSGGRSLLRFDPSNNYFDIKYDSREIHSPINDFFINSLFIDHQNNLWIGGDNEIKKRVNKTGDWESFHFDFPIGEKTENWVNSIYEDNQNLLWIATEHGVVRLNSKTNQYRIYSENEMVPEEYVSWIFGDYKGRIWIATGNFLALYNPKEDRFHPFTRNDGVELSNWLMGAYSDKDHFIFMPTINSDMSYFHPDSLKINTTVPNIYFTRFQLFNSNVKAGDSTGILKKALDFSSEINLKHHQNDFTIHFTAPEYKHPKATLFAIKMENFHEDWQEIGNKREATFTNLDPGSYIFKVKAQNHHGFWSKTTRSFKIIVQPPWYLTWWAYSLWTLLFLGSIYGVYRFQLNRRLAQAEAQRLKELDLAKTRLYTNITHEFRTPLTIILGMVNQVNKDPGNWLKEGTRLIRRNGKQLLNLVNQLLDLSKLESGHLPLNLIQGDIVRFLQYLTESFHSYADGKDIRLHFKSDVEELKMDHDPEKLQHVISNLLSNGIKFTPAGGDVYLHLRVSNSSIKNNIPSPSEIQIEVSDNGPGIAPEHLPHIFDRFYQADDTNTRRGEGTGIGLALTKELLKIMGGRIEVKSELNKGTQFNIHLPVTRQAEEASKIESPQSREGLDATIIPDALSKKENTPIAPSNTQNLILLVDDNQDVLTYLTSVLSLHYRIATASNGQEGIDKAKELLPDLIVSDVMMPDKDGFELCEELKTNEHTDHIPIILLTAKADLGSKIEGLKNGADAYLSKPFHKEELLVRLEKLIDLRHRLQQRFQKAGGLRQLLLSPPKEKQDLFLQQVMRIIEKRMEDENFGIPDLCKELHMSRTTLFRKLKALTGKSAINIIRSFRLEKAKDLLETTELSVGEIGYQVGFRNPNYFSTVFSEEYGMSPRELRRR